MTKTTTPTADAHDIIRVRGARENNLKDVSVDGSVSWKCRAVGSTAAPTTTIMPGATNAVGTVLAKYAPAECRA